MPKHVAAWNALALEASLAQLARCPGRPGGLWSRPHPVNRMTGNPADA